MGMTENRRARLKQWFAGKTMPANEKSYLSQLVRGKASFGERAARRLERDYGMGVGYLDQPADEPMEAMKTPKAERKNVVDLDRVAIGQEKRRSPEVSEIITLLNSMDPLGVGMVLSYTRDVAVERKATKSKRAK